MTNITFPYKLPATINADTPAVKKLVGDLLEQINDEVYKLAMETPEISLPEYSEDEEMDRAIMIVTAALEELVYRSLAAKMGFFKI